MSIDKLKKNLTSPARKYMWDVIFTDPLGGGNTEVLMVRARSTSVPTRSFGKIHIPYKQTGGVEFHGKLNYTHSWTVTFVEGEDAAVFKEFYNAAQKIVHDKLGTGLPESIIKKDVILSLRNTADKEYLRIKLWGTWIENNGEISLDYSSDGEATFTATLSYDYWTKE